ncbi:MAG: hypothetical protein JWM75_529 [Sphingomonas bacterium]|nr:hypothetical protein [Sphingomonas bacterium]
MTDGEVLLAQIEEACRRLKIAQSTFGRQAVNDGKFVNRLQQGGRVTLQTVERVHRFIESQGGPSLRSAVNDASALSPAHNFRFYDNRQKYLMFVNTSSEKQIVADRALEQLTFAQPEPPALRLFDGGSGDGTVLARLLRGVHRRYPWLPLYVVAKEISAENVRLMLERMPDRFQEHPATVLVVTNLNYAHAPWLMPGSPVAASAMVWEEVGLTGDKAGDFEEAIAGLQSFVERNWQVEISPGSGHPLPRTPAVLVLYRRDQRFVLDSILPRRGAARADFDLAVLSHAYRARSPIAFKATTIVAPLVRALRRNGRLMGVQAYGHDPGMEIIREIWPSEEPFVHGREALMREVATALGADARRYHFHEASNDEALFRFRIHTLQSEVDPKAEIGSSTLIAAWNAASYVAQIEDARLATVMDHDRYLEVTRETLRRHGGLWFNDEAFLISRPADLHQVMSGGARPSHTEENP